MITALNSFLTQQYLDGYWRNPEVNHLGNEEEWPWKYRSGFDGRRDAPSAPSAPHLPTTDGPGSGVSSEAATTESKKEGSISTGLQTRRGKRKSK
jgi:hypothetical protein